MNKKLPIILLASLMAVGAGAIASAAANPEKETEVKAATADVGTFNIIRGTEGVDYTLDGNKITTTSSGDLLLESTVDVFNTGHLKIDDYLFPLLNDGTQCGVSIILNATVNGTGQITGDVIRPYIDKDWSDNPIYLCQGWIIDDVYGTSNDEWSDHTNVLHQDFEYWWTPAIGACTMNGWRSRAFFNGWDGNKVYIHVKNTACYIDNPRVEDTHHAIYNLTYRHQWGYTMLRQRTTCFNNNETHAFTMHLPNDVNLADINHLYVSKYAPHGRTTDYAQVTVNGGTAVGWEIQDSQTGYGNFEVEIDKSLIDENRDYRISIHNTAGEYAVSMYGLIYDIDGVLYAADRLICGHGLSETAHSYYESGAGWRGTQEWEIRPGKGYKLIGRPGDVVETIDYPTFTAIESSITKTFAKATAFDFLSNINVIANGMDYRHELWLDFGYGSSKVTEDGADAFSYLFTESTSCQWFVDLFMTNNDNSGVYKVSIGGSITVTVVASDDAISWASAFNTAISAVCKMDGTTDVTNDLAPAWENVKSSYLALSADAKEALLSSTNPTVVSAIEKYDYIINKYGVSLNNFLGRDTSGSGSRVAAPSLTQRNATICTIVIITFVITSLSVVGIVLLKKRKVER